jgi:cytochrome c peroxidase
MRHFVPAWHVGRLWNYNMMPNVPQQLQDRLMRPPLKPAIAAVALCLSLACLAKVAPPHLVQAVAVAPYQEPITPIPAAPAADPLKVALGDDLFHDPLLSHDQKLSCSSCHDTRSNGADGLLHVAGTDDTPLAFDTPTVFNAALSFRLNWEGNERSLEAQAESAIERGHGGMGSTMPEVVARLSSDATMAQHFVTAYGREPDRTSVLDALATYERSLVTPDSRFDRWLDGDEGALSAQEKTGYDLFKSFGCVSCHQGVNIGGNLFQRHGIFHRLASLEPKILRVPSLRNVATTAPYFHDGSAPTLAVAVRRMASAQLDQSLSEQELGAIVAFLGTLTGTYRGAVVKAPAP